MIGYKVVKTFGVSWRYYSGALIPQEPPHLNVKLSRFKLLLTLLKNRALFLRFEKNFDCKQEKRWWHVIKDKKEDLSEYSSNTRNQIRKGLKKYKALRTNKLDISRNGYDVYYKSFMRYKGEEKILRKCQFMRAISRVPEETKFWKVIDIQTNLIVGFSENIVSKKVCFYNSIWFMPNSMKDYANYVLIHEMNKYYLNILNLRYVNDGARSIYHKTNIQDFLESKFKFRKAYSELNIVYLPFIGITLKLLVIFQRYLNFLPLNLKDKLFALVAQEKIRCNFKN